MMLRRLVHKKLLLCRTNGRHTPEIALRAYSISKDDSSKDADKFEDWIPPDRPLAGDQGQSHLYAPQQEEDSDKMIQHIEEELERLEKEEAAPSEDTFTETSVDWLKTRRKVLGSEEQGESGVGLMSPKEAASRKQDMSDIPIKEHMLLSKDEIATCLETLGGTDISVILDNPKKRRMGGAIGLIIVTAYSNTQIRMLADTLVRQLRRRKLHEVGVVGAQLGPEGADDPDENWYVVDCRNYVVHIQGERIRKAIDLEGLWSGRDGLFNVNQLDEDEVDDWVAANPVPDDYGFPVFDWDSKLKKLEKSRYTARHRPVISKKKGKKARKRKG